MNFLINTYFFNNFHVYYNIMSKFLDIMELHLIIVHTQNAHSSFKITQAIRLLLIYGGVAKFKKSTRIVKTHVYIKVSGSSSAGGRVLGVQID